MKILFLSQRVPFPPNRGDKITTWRLIERLAREHTVEIVAFAHDEADVKAADDLRAKGFDIATFSPKAKWQAAPCFLTGKPITLGVFGSKEMQTEVDRRITSCDMAYAYSSSMGAYYLHHDLPRVMHFAELDSDKWAQYAKKTSWPMSWVYAREHRTLFEFEKDLAARTIDNVFCTPLEQKIFNERIPGCPSIVMRNGVDLGLFQPSEATREPNHLIFVGVMNYYPNVDGCKWFCESILPRVRERHPDVKLSIVGSHPTPDVEALGKLPGVTVTGFVDDTRDWLNKASVSIAPLRIARGIQNKVLEAMAMGLPVVGTTSATQGVDGTPEQDFLLANSETEQVEAVCRLLDDQNAAIELGRRARAFVEANYDWEVCLEPLDDIVARSAGPVVAV